MTFHKCFSFWIPWTTSNSVDVLIAYTKRSKLMKRAAAVHFMKSTQCRSIAVSQGYWLEEIQSRYLSAVNVQGVDDGDQSHVIDKKVSRSRRSIFHHVTCGMRVQHEVLSRARHATNLSSSASHRYELLCAGRVYANSLIELLLSRTAFQGSCKAL